MSLIKRFISTFLVFAFLIPLSTSFLPQKAEAAGEALTTEALGALLAVCAGAGVYITGTQTDIASYLSEKVDSFVSSADRTIKDAIASITFDRLGCHVLDDDATIQEFVEGLGGSSAVPAGTYETVVDGITIVRGGYVGFTNVVDGSAVVGSTVTPIPSYSGFYYTVEAGSGTGAKNIAVYIDSVKILDCTVGSYHKPFKWGIGARNSMDEWVVRYENSNGGGNMRIESATFIAFLESCFSVTVDSAEVDASVLAPVDGQAVTITGVTSPQDVIDKALEGTLSDLVIDGTTTGEGGGTEIPIEDGTEYTGLFETTIGALNGIKELFVPFPQWMDDVKSKITSIPSEITTSIDGVKDLFIPFPQWMEDIKEIFLPIPQMLEDIKTRVTSLPSDIAQALENVWTGVKEWVISLVFPSEAVLDQARVMYAEKFPIIPDLKNFAMDFENTLKNPSQSASALALTTMVDLGKREDGLYGNASINFFDFSWYVEKYKKTGDAVITGFFWCLFLWNLYGQLPRIINGGSGSLVAYEYSMKHDEKRKGKE